MIGRVLQTWRERTERGNAVLFSLIIMAAAMVISLGMVTLVANEARTVGLTLPGERAYYKAESYVEQALWEKKVNPNYQIAKKADLPAEFLCAGNGCEPFSSKPTGQNNDDLNQFFATTSPINDEIGLQPDVPLQLDIDPTNSSGDAAKLTIGDIEGENDYRGMEVTIVAFPKEGQSQIAKFPNDDPATAAVEQAATPVFIDKKFVPPGTQDVTFNLGKAATPNKLGEVYPDFNTNNTYRVRLKALGAAATATVKATPTSGSGSHTIVSTDFTVRSVAKDLNATRGLQVLIPNAEQTASIFDFVLFSDLDLHKLGAKVNGVTSKSITTRVVRDTNQNCVADVGETGISNVPVTLSPGYKASTGSDGSITFPNLQPSTNYTATSAAVAGTEYCAPGNTKAFTTSAGTANDNQIYTFLVRTPLPARVPVYRWFYNYGLHNGAYDYDFYSSTLSFVQNYTNGGVGFYVYPGQQLGQIPIYAYQPLPNFGAKYYATYPVNGSANINFYAAPYDGSCPSGSLPIWSMTHPANPQYVSNLLTVNLSERASLISQGWVSNGVLACAWSSG